MPALQFDAFPDGKRKAFIASYDDGQVADRRLVEAFNRHGIRGTFHLYTDVLGGEGFVSPGEVKGLYEGHEVAGHSHTHPHLPHLAGEGVLVELLESRRRLEGLVGYPVRGFAYPGGGVDGRVVELLKASGAAYGRTTERASSFLIADDFFRFPITCHHSQALEKLAQWRALPPRWSSQVFVMMGHSFDFDRARNWDLLDQVCAMAGGDNAVWYTTMIGLVEYQEAVSRMRCSVDGRVAFNPSALPVWATAEGERIVCIEPGGTWRA